MLLRQSSERQAAADVMVKQLHDKNSPSFHHWLTATAFGRTYGAAPEDIASVTGWLTSQGFKVNGVYPSGLMIDFSGTAGQVRTAFRTEIHKLHVDGEAHMPAALAPAVRGVVSMHDFRPRVMKKARPAYTFGSGNAQTQAVTPGDLATIYNLNPLFAAGITLLWDFGRDGPQVDGERRVVHFEQRLFSGLSGVSRVEHGDRDRLCECVQPGDELESVTRYHEWN